MLIDIPDQLVQDVQFVDAVHNGRSRCKNLKELESNIREAEMITSHISDQVVSLIQRELWKMRK